MWPDLFCGLSAYLFRNATAGADEALPVLFFNPTGKCGALVVLDPMLLVSVMFAFCGLRAAVFTEPAITQIEKVGRLVHRPQFT